MVFVVPNSIGSVCGPSGISETCRSPVCKAPTPIPEHSLRLLTKQSSDFSTLHFLSAYIWGLQGTIERLETVLVFRRLCLWLEGVEFLLKDRC